MYSLLNQFLNQVLEVKSEPVFLGEVDKEDMDERMSSCLLEVHSEGNTEVQ